MDLKSNENKQKRLKKLIDTLDGIFECSTMFGGFIASFAIIALLLGGASELTSNITMNQKAQEIYKSAEYQAIANEGLAQLDKKLNAGEIGQKEYSEGIEALYSIPEVIRFAENANDTELSSFIENYKESQELSEAVFTRGLPFFGSMSVVGIAGATVSGISSRKARKKLEETDGSLEEESIIK